MRTCNIHGTCLKRCLPLLLCVCILLAMTACRIHTAQSDTEEDILKISYDTPREWMPVYNHHEHGVFASFNLNIPIKKELTQEDIDKILPPKSLPFEVTEGEAWFDEDRSTIRVMLRIDTQEGGITVVFGQLTVLLGCCTSFDPNAEVSSCGDVEYQLYEFEDSVSHELIAKADFQGVPMMARGMDASKADFEAVLECFSWYPDGKPNLEKLDP